MCSAKIYNTPSQPFRLRWPSSAPIAWLRNAGYATGTKTTAAASDYTTTQDVITDRKWRNMHATSTQSIWLPADALLCPMFSGLFQFGLAETYKKLRITIYGGPYSRHLKKIAIFTYPGLHFLFALGTPLWQSRKTLHEWKDNSVLAKPLAACTYLSSIVSELYDA